MDRCTCKFELDSNGKPIFDADIEKIPLDCPTTWDLFCTGNLYGVFQCESQLVRSFAKKLKPRSIEHLSALISIVRPGCLESIMDGKNLTMHYIDRKNGDEEITYFHPSLKSCLKDTYGILVYQESILEICKVIAGFNLQEADALRKAVGKKIASEMTKVRTKFEEGAKKVGLLNEEQVKQLFDWIEKSQRYLFNKCLSWDTVLFRERNTGYTVEHMYNIRNDIQYAKAHGHLSLYKKWKLAGNYCNGFSLCEDGRVRPNIIENISKAGVRDIYEITLENGATIKVTDNHKFPTVNGLKPLSELTLDDYLYFKLGYEKGNGKKYGFSDVTKEDLRKKQSEHDHKTEGFMDGTKNPGYTNGSYTAYKEARADLSDFCVRCGASGCRIELHHKDGNRTNSSLENLEPLCMSCHNAGRVRKGEKGYPTELVKIASIEYIGKEQTYDVTMRGPNHTVVVDTGIVTCNSHGVGYALTSYLTAYAKAHFPLEFFTAYLYYAREKIDPLHEIKDLVYNAKSMNIEVLGPTFLNIQERFHLDDGRIRFGLSDVKSVGSAIFHKIKKNVDEYPDYRSWSWLEFLVNFSSFINSAAFKSLASVGAFNYFGISRSRLLYEYEVFGNLTKREVEWLKKNLLGCGKQGVVGESLDLTAALGAMLAAPVGKNGAVSNKKRYASIESLFQLLQKPPHSLDDSPDWIASVEESLLGVPLTCTKIEGKSKAYVANTDCKEFANGGIKDACLAVKVDDSREIETKNGKFRGQKMAFLNVSDNSGSLDNVVVFAQTWEKLGKLCQIGNTVLLTGRRDKKQGTLIVQNIDQL